MPMALIFVLTFACLALPWWWCALIAYAVGFFAPRAGIAFRAGFFGVAFAWLLRAGLLDWRNHGLLAARVAALFHLPLTFWLYAITAMIGGIAGGLGAWAGQSLGSYLRGVGYFRGWFSKNLG
jgi:hypothetical protein